MYGGELQLVTLFSQGREFLMRAEIIGRHLERFRPAGDAFGQRLVYVLKSLLRGGIAGLADAVEDPASGGLLLGLVAQERILERHVLIGRIDAHGFGELVARRLVFTDF